MHSGEATDWADGNFCFCSLLNRDILSGASAALPPELRQVAEMLMTQSVAEVARELGIQGDNKRCESSHRRAWRLGGAPKAAA